MAALFWIQLWGLFWKNLILLSRSPIVCVVFFCWRRQALIIILRHLCFAVFCCPLLTPYSLDMPSPSSADSIMYANSVSRGSEAKLRASWETVPPCLYSPLGRNSQGPSLWHGQTTRPVSRHQVLNRSLTASLPILVQHNAQVYAKSLPPSTSLQHALGTTTISLNVSPEFPLIVCLGKEALSTTLFSSTAALERLMFKVSEATIRHE